MAMLVYMKNLSPATKDTDVRKFFDQAEVEISEGGLNISKSKDGTAFVNFSSSQDLLEAVKLDGQELLGRPVKLLLITVEEKEEILTEIRKEELLAATRPKTGSSERGKQGVKAGGGGGASMGSSRDSTYEDYLMVSGLPSNVRRKNLIDFLEANPPMIAKNGIVIRPTEGDENRVVAFVKFIKEESFNRGLTKNGESYNGEEVFVRQSGRQEFEKEMANSGLNDSKKPVDSRKRSHDETAEDDTKGKKAKPSNEEEGEAYYTIVKNLFGDIRPNALKEVFGWIEYDKIVLRPDKKDISKCVAFMKFSDSESYEKALNANREYLQGQQIFVKPYTEGGFEAERRQHGTHADRLAMADLYLFITNIEGSVSERDLRKFFGRKIWDAIPDDGMLMRPDLKFPQKQVAYINFRTKEAYETILNTENRFLNGKWIVVKKSSEKQFMIQRRFIEEENQQMQGYGDFNRGGPNFDRPMSGGVGGNGWNGNRGPNNFGGYDSNMRGPGNAGFGGDMGAGNNFMGQAPCCILVNNLPSHADIKWVHQLFDDCPIKVSQTRLVCEGMLPLYAYVELQTEMDLARACSRDGRRFESVVISVRKVLHEAVERDLNTLPPRMRVSKMKMEDWFGAQGQQNAFKDPFVEPRQDTSHSQDFGQTDNYNYNQQDRKPYNYGNNYSDQGADVWSDPQMGDQSNTPNAVLAAIRELENACGNNVEVVELKVLPHKLSHDSVYEWLKQQPGNLEVVGKNSDIVNFGNSQVEIILIAVKSFTTALPKWAFIGKVICEIKHRSQRNACPGCRRLDHRTVSEGCPANADNSDVIYFDAADHPFSPLHMSMMPFVFKGKSFINILQAYLWEECHQLGLGDVRNGILRTHDPRMSNLKEFIFAIPKLEALNWEMKSYEVLGNLYKLKWEVCPEFREALYDTGNKMLVFANSRCSLGVGIQPANLVRKINPMYYQGENIIGKIIMNIREEKNHLYRE